MLLVVELVTSDCGGIADEPELLQFAETSCTLVTLKVFLSPAEAEAVALPLFAVTCVCSLLPVTEMV